MLFYLRGDVCVRVLLGMELGGSYMYWASILPLNYVPDVFE